MSEVRQNDLKIRKRKESTCEKEWEQEPNQKDLTSNTRSRLNLNHIFQEFIVENEKEIPFS